MTFDRPLRHIALVVVSGAIMTILDTTIVNVAINTLGRDLHTSLSTIQWVLTGYTLALTMAIPITGWSVERFGTKAMWLASLTLFIAGSMLCGAAWSAYSLIAFRVLQGFGGGLLMPVGQTMLARAAGPDRMGRVMSVVTVPAMLAPILGPVLGGVIVDNLSWRWMFYVNLPICAAALLLAVRLLPADPERQPARKLDVLGFALLSPGLAALVYGLSEAGENASPRNPRLVIGLAIGIVLIGAFAIRSLAPALVAGRQRRGAPDPLLDLRLFRDRSFTVANAAMFVVGAAMFGLIILVPLYYQLLRGESPLHTGLLIAPFGVGALSTLLISGRAADRYGARAVVPAGIAVFLLGALVYTQVTADTSKVLLGAGFLVTGMGYGPIVPPLTAAVYQRLPRTALPGATTASSIIIRFGGSLGTALFAVVLQIAIRAEVPGASGSLADAATSSGSPTAAALARAFGHTFWWAIGMALASLILVLMIPRRRAVEAAPELAVQH